MLYWARRYDEAMQQARVTIEMEPNFAHAHRVLERIYDEKHMYPEAIAEGERAVALSGDDMWMLLDLATTYALAGHLSDMRDCSEESIQDEPGRCSASDRNHFRAVCGVGRFRSRVPGHGKSISPPRGRAHSAERRSALRCTSNPTCASNSWCSGSAFRRLPDETRSALHLAHSLRT
jgi:tetratricopeptide (TPR) repeat protein